MQDECNGQCENCEKEAEPMTETQGHPGESIVEELAEKWDAIDGEKLQQLWLKAQLAEMINRRIERNPRYTGIQVPIDNVQWHVVDNVTIVVVDSGGEQVVGWSKFNPKDIKITRFYNKKGRYVVRQESQYNEKIGLVKALVRVVDQLIDS